MNDDEMRIALAEACPEVFRRTTGAAGWNYYNSTVGRVVPCIDGDPLKDLNAMAEARKTLKDDAQRSRYFESLHKVVGIFSDNPQWMMIDASAAKHAEAFLKMKLF